MRELFTSSSDLLKMNGGNIYTKDNLKKNIILDNNNNLAYGKYKKYKMLYKKLKVLN